MTPPMFSLCVTCLLMRTMDVTALKSSSFHFVSVNIGQNVTLECAYENTVAVMFYWYKQRPGEKPQVVSKHYKHDKRGSFIDEFKKDPRFKLETNAGINNLKISNVQSSDSATYYCVSGYSYVFEFLENIFVSVEHSGSHATVHQPASETIQPGGSVTLNCTVNTGTCNEELSVYWFKDSGASLPGFIYTNGDRNDQCEIIPKTQTSTCIYSLPLKSLNDSHIGTYFCAVVSCGQILFGKGTTVVFEDEDDFFLVYVLSGALTFTTFLVAFLAYKTFAALKTNSCQCADPQERSSLPPAPNTEGHQDEENLHYAALKKNNISKSRRQRDTTSTCVYSTVRQKM
ncbi:uncharacterized protein [Channa argus]|uniref:uncharacterized protein isoform X2 n=1 Tax=Channa argus TaxID=215402 RepID=UPI003522DC2F